MERKMFLSLQTAYSNTVPKTYIKNNQKIDLTWRLNKYTIAFLTRDLAALVLLPKNKNKTNRKEQLEDRSQVTNSQEVHAHD